MQNENRKVRVNDILLLADLFINPGTATEFYDIPSSPDLIAEVII
jgi:hypothetical protein